MSASASPAHTGLAGPLHRITGKWGWFVALGVLSILAGLFALTDVVAFTLVSTIFIGAMLLVSGIFQIIHAFATKTWGQFALTVLLGLLYVAGGLLIMDEPVQGSFVITLMLLIALVVSGIVRIVIALRPRAGRVVQRGDWRVAVPGAAVVEPVHPGHADRRRAADPGRHLAAIRPGAAPQAQAQGRRLTPRRLTCGRQRGPRI